MAGIDEDQLAGLQAELRGLLGVRSVAGLAEQATPALDELVGSVEGNGAAWARILSEQLTSAIARIGNDSYRRAATILLEDLGDGRSIKERGTSAAAVFAQGYDAFRRRVEGQSRMDDVLQLVAVELVEQSSESAVITTASPSGRRIWLVGGALAATAAIILVVAISVSSGNDSNVTDPVADPTVTNTGPPEPLAESAEPDTSTEPDEPESKDLDATVVFAGLPSLGMVEAVCEFDAGELSSDQPEDAAEYAALFAATYSREGGVSQLGCPVETMAFRGGLYWQELRRFGIANGGMLGMPGTDVMLMNVGQWRSFIRIGGSDGSRSQLLGGTPTGEVVQTVDGWQIRLDSQVELIAEGVDGTYYWLPALLIDAWVEGGRSAGEPGGPTGSPRIVSEGLRQDFENGYFLLDSVGELSFVRVDNTAGLLPSAADLQGRIVGAADGTGWLVDEDLRRWWIPDVQTWFCAGGEQNAVAEDLPGYAIHTLEYGGVLTCPASLVGVTPAGGRLSMTEYCAMAVASETNAENSGDRWVCTDGAKSGWIDFELACKWQYGPTSVPLVGSETGDVNCA